MEALNRGEGELLGRLVEKWGFPGEWLIVPPGGFDIPRSLTREETATALAWWKAREPAEPEPEPEPEFEGLVFREPLWE